MIIFLVDTSPWFPWCVYHISRVLASWATQPGLPVSDDITLHTRTAHLCLTITHGWSFPCFVVFNHYWHLSISKMFTAVDYNVNYFIDHYVVSRAGPSNNIPMLTHYIQVPYFFWVPVQYKYVYSRALLFVSVYKPQLSLKISDVCCKLLHYCAIFSPLYYKNPILVLA